MLGAATEVSTSWTTWRAPHARTSDFSQQQQQRLDALVTHARTQSPFYKQRYATLPMQATDLRHLPIVDKPELMAHFDAWSTDRAITRASVDAFIANPALLGSDVLGRYAVWTTSGTSGQPGIFVQDRAALRVYRALVALRFYPAWMTPLLLARTLRRGWRTAGVFATGGHFGSVDLIARLQRAPALKNRVQIFSVLEPLSDLVDALNRFQPAILAAYPSALALLAAAQRTGTLRIQPTLLTAAGEPLDPVARSDLEVSFDAPVYTNYGATEAPYIAFDCRYGQLHVNADWYILEPVDQEFRPVPPGEPSHSVLITNLANRVQPIIRYNLGDSITVSPNRCACGSRLPVIEVVGRTNDVLVFQNVNGAVVRLLPLALGTVIEETPGVERFLAIQTAPQTLRVRLQAATDTHDPHVWSALARRLTTYLAAQGLPEVQLERDPEAPHPDPASGKYRQVWSEVSGAVRW